MIKILIAIFFIGSSQNLLYSESCQNRNCKYQKFLLKDSKSSEYASQSKNVKVIDIGSERISDKWAAMAQAYTIVNFYGENPQIHKICELKNWGNVSLRDSKENLDISCDILLSSNFIPYLNTSSFPFIAPLIKKAKEGLLIFDIQETKENSYIELITWFYENKINIKISQTKNLVCLAWKELTLAYEVQQENLEDRPLCPPFSPEKGSNAITYSLMGRLGDSMIAYFHAKWVAYQHNLPFLYYPFQSAGLLHFDSLEPCASNFNFKNIVTVESESQISREPTSTLFVVPYLPECEFEYNMYKWGPLPFIKVNWEDPLFHREFVRAVTPKNPVKTTELPKDRLTVGVHIRRGGGFDSATANLSWPLKFPPDDFYINQIELLGRMFPTQSIFVLILTDDLSPQIIVEKYKKIINNPNIEIAYRTGEVGPHSNILEDFFTIPKFDCLILCKSNFSLMASKLKNYEVLITPVHAYIVNEQIFIDEIEYKFSTNATLFKDRIKSCGF